MKKNYNHIVRNLILILLVFEVWVQNKKNANLKYLEGERKEKRAHLKEVYPSFKSALVFLFDYTNDKKTLDNISKDKDQKIAGYTFGFNGGDYHYFVKDALSELVEKSNLPSECKIIVDV